MKGPSLDAIRKFKQQQEQRKRQEDEKKIQEKLSTLEHRAQQGDKKAKATLKKIEQAQETKTEDYTPNQSRAGSQNHYGSRQPTSYTSSHSDSNKSNQTRRKPNKTETNFEELMELASTNNNEIRIEKKPQENSSRNAQKRRKETAIITQQDTLCTKTLRTSLPTGERVVPKQSRVESQPSTSRNLPTRPQHQRVAPQASRVPASHGPPPCHRLPPSHRPPPPNYRPPSNYRPSPRPPVRPVYDDYYDDEEDEYELDDFVVNENDDEAQAELSKTLKDIFRYDKRRCDLREQELDRQYRAIGRVSTFEDLEREERRAGRLAAAEDAQEQRVEEERKRQKKIRLGY